MLQRFALELTSYLVRRLPLLIPVLFGVTPFVFGITMLFSRIERASRYLTSAGQMSRT
jgi:hypothetical protein